MPNRDKMSAIDRITVDPDVCGGRPCIRGLRIRVKDVLDLLAAGATREEILADYPYLEATTSRPSWNSRPDKTIIRFCEARNCASSSTPNCRPRWHGALRRSAIQRSTWRTVVWPPRPTE